MEKNTKILLGVVAASVLAYLLWKNSKKLSAPASQPVEGKYEVLEDFQTTTTVGGVVGIRTTKFIKGEIIGASPNPYSDSKELYTTFNKEIPNYGSIGQNWVRVPIDKVKLVS